VNEVDISLKVEKILYTEGNIVDTTSVFDYREHVLDMIMWIAKSGNLRAQQNLTYLLRMDDFKFQLAMKVIEIGSDEQY